MSRSSGVDHPIRGGTDEGPDVFVYALRAAPQANEQGDEQLEAHGGVLESKVLNQLLGYISFLSLLPWILRVISRSPSSILARICSVLLQGAAYAEHYPLTPLPAPCRTRCIKPRHLYSGWKGFYILQA